MIYQRPKGLNYCDMCIYIDNNIYKEDCNEDICFQYMYHLYMMLSYKGKLFQNISDYEDFALYAASCTLARYRNIYSKSKEKKRIKSILNWAKRALYGLSVNFKNKQFGDILEEANLGEDGLDNLKKDLASQVQSKNSQNLGIEIQHYFSYIPSTIYNIIKESPYSNLKRDIHNIYLSVLLTFISSLTISNKNNKRILKSRCRSNSSSNLIDNIYKEEREKNKVISFHLPKTMNNYISYLVNRVRKVLSKDLGYLIGTYKLSEDLVRDILMPENLEKILGENYD